MHVFSPLRLVCTSKKATAFLLTFVVVLALPFSYVGTLKKAEALSIGGIANLAGGLIGGGGGDLVKDVGNTIQNTLQTLSVQSLEQKELNLDGIFFDIAQKALQDMTGDIVKWLNSGMDGNPSFVTDVLTYFQEVADEAAADFIYGEELGTVCKPFENDLRQNLSEAYKTTAYGGGEEKVACTIDDAGADVEAFVQGDFDAGGWSVWFETVLNPANTGTGVNSAALVVNHDRLAAANFAAKTETDWGRGVLSKKTCTVVGTGAFAKDVCTITTPGSIMQELGTKALGTGIDSLLNADEMNEVIGVLYGNLAKEAVTGINGLLGLGGNAQFSNNTFGSGGNLSYLDAIKQESVNKKPGSGVNGNKIQQALATETKVLELQLAIVDTISTTTNFFASTSEPFIGKSCWDLTLPDALSTTLVQLSAKLPTTIGTVIALQDMVEEFASTTSAAGQLRLLEQLTGLQSQGLLSGQAAVVEYDYFLNSELKVFIADFKKKIIEEVKGCS